MDQIKTGATCSTYTKQLRRKGHTIGLVPTMGCLHDAHLSLIETSLRETNDTIVSIYVNPSQFSKGEDYKTYPRNLQDDLDRLAPYNITAVFIPKDKDIYGKSSHHNHTKIIVPKLSNHGCGQSRPNFFSGVTTVLYKLFKLTNATHVYLGKKDFQQLKIVQKMIQDLELPIQAIGCPTIREPSGLAMSSRNIYLSKKEKKDASKIYQTLQEAQTMAQKTQNPKDIIQYVKTQLNTIPNFKIDYVECLKKTDLQPTETLKSPTQLIIAGNLKKTRLIDNISLA